MCQQVSKSEPKVPELGIVYMALGKDEAVICSIASLRCKLRKQACVLPSIAQGTIA